MEDYKVYNASAKFCILKKKEKKEERKWEKEKKTRFIIHSTSKEGGRINSEANSSSFLANISFKLHLKFLDLSTQNLRWIFFSKE